MSTNGTLLAEVPFFVGDLKQSRLDYWYLQFDSLDPETHRAIRGNDFIRMKQTALQNAKNSRAAACDHYYNREAQYRGAWIAPVMPARFSPALDPCVFTVAGNTERFNLDESALITREDIITELVAPGFLPGLKIQDFLPFPRFRPFGVDVHPACGGLLLLYTHRRKHHLLQDVYNVQHFLRLMALPKKRSGKPVGFFYICLCYCRFVLPKQAPFFRSCWEPGTLHFNRQGLIRIVSGGVIFF